MSENRHLRRARLRGVLWAIVPVVIVTILFCCALPYLQLMGFFQFPQLSSFGNPAIAAFNPAPAPFDQAKWDRGHATDRIAMGKWLEKSGTLNGMKRDELVAQLGPFDSENEHEGKTQLTWELGDLDDGGLFIRHMHLLVKIDPKGTVVDAYIYSTD